MASSRPDVRRRAAPLEAEKKERRRLKFSKSPTSLKAEKKERGLKSGGRTIPPRREVPIFIIILFSGITNWAGNLASVTTGRGGERMVRRSRYVP